MKKTLIKATSKEEFEKIENEINKLSESVKDQIKLASFLALLGCECELSYNNDYCVTLPKKVRQIKYFGDYIGIYCEDFFFKVFHNGNQINFILETE